jgi:hypothetical protein
MSIGRTSTRVSAEWKDRLGVLAQEKVFLPDSSPSPAQVRKSPEVGELRERWVEEFRVGLSSGESAELVFTRIRDREVPDWTNSLLALTEEEIAARHRENPWRRRKGWESEPQLPILTKDDGKTPEEPGYVVRNELVASRYFRPFRTTTGEPRVTFPTRFGVEVRDPSSDEFVDVVGYRFWTLDGKRVPLKDLAVAARALTQRALARELPQERIVDLAIRVAPDGQGGSLLDLADRLHRCVHISAAGWTLETVGYPIFDAPSHLSALPEPLLSEDPKEGRKRYDRLFEFVNLPVPSADGADPRLLTAAVHVQFLIAPATPKPVVALIAGEGATKTSAAERLQGLVDPSKVPSLGTPENPKELAEWAYNRATINLDNLSHVADWLSDGLARLCTGAGLAKRELYTNRGEVIARRIPWILFNGITSTPRHADLIRRAIFPELERPARRLSLSELEEKWRGAHPVILGGLLDLATLTLAALRERGPDSSPAEDSMADYVRIGRALGVVTGRDFDRAWAHNLEKQGTTAAENPWVGVLFEQLEKQVEPVTASFIAKRINEGDRESFGKPVTAQQVGTQIASCKLTLERMGLRIGTRMRDGITRYFRQISESGPLAPLETFYTDGKSASGPLSGPQVDHASRSTSVSVDLSGGVHLGSQSPFSDEKSGPSGPSGDTFKVSGSGPSIPFERASLETDESAVKEEAENWTVSPGDRARRRNEP